MMLAYLWSILPWWSVLFIPLPNHDDRQTVVVRQWEAEGPSYFDALTKDIKKGE